ncbi:MAG: hypothetical protein ACI8WB_000912 [Phenylobacterium sp.]|jgi:hypothetical protein
MQNQIRFIFYVALAIEAWVSGDASSQTLHLKATEDATLSAAVDKSSINFGSEQFMTLLNQPHTQRVVTKFDLDSLLLAGTQPIDILSASIQFEVKFNDGQWPPGQSKANLIDIHPLLMPWTESAVTWDCPIDTNLSNPQTGCIGQWDGGNYALASQSIDVKSISSGIVQFDVTEDIKAFLDGSTEHFGWLIKKQKEDKSGIISFYSKETSFAPTLIINVSDEVDLPPVVNIVNPDSKLYIAQGPENIIVNYSDGGQVLTPALVFIWLDGVQILCTKTATTAICDLPELEQRTYNVTVSVTDAADKTTRVNASFMYLTSLVGSTTASKWLAQVGSPRRVDGNIGDMYLNQSNGNVYQKTNGGWSYKMTISGPQGPQGIQGLQGIEGPQGPMGFQGVPGSHGLDGVDGAKGDKGDAGAKGDKGADGAKGDAGADGAKGDAGADGAKGDAGADGAKGDAGADGAKGDAGADGAKGDAGADGAKGDAGADGAKGDAGADGAKGDAGADGAKGNAGANGAKGDTGADGAKGDAGADGAKGDAGADGAKGDAGADGAKGNAGADGAKGDKGNAGTSGTDGAKGDKGDAGTDGAKGDKGDTGAQGLPGSTLSQSCNWSGLLKISGDQSCQDNIGICCTNNLISGYYKLSCGASPGWENPPACP